MSTFPFSFSPPPGLRAHRMLLLVEWYTWLGPRLLKT